MIRPNTAKAPAFAALGDPTRLAMVITLSTGESHSIAELRQGSQLTRQAVTKHLRILEAEQLVASERQGREMRYTLQPQKIAELRDFLAAVSSHWD